MTAREFRGSYAWKRARRIAVRGANGCAICGGSFRLDVGPRHRLYPTVDHVIPLADLDLTSAAGRAVAVDQALLRAVHNGCNASRGARDGNQRRASAVPRAYRDGRAPPAEATAEQQAERARREHAAHVRSLGWMGSERFGRHWGGWARGQTGDQWSAGCAPDEDVCPACPCEACRAHFLPCPCADCRRRQRSENVNTTEGEHDG